MLLVIFNEETADEPAMRAALAGRHLPAGAELTPGECERFEALRVWRDRRAAEMGCDALLKGTSVDGVYTADPKKDPSATRYETLTYQDVLAKDLRVMDASAIALMRDNQIPIVVFSIRERGNFFKVLKGQGVFTTIA